MDLYNDTDFSITIDDFTFVLKTKHYIFDKKYLIFNSINNLNNKEITLSAYTSTSELGCWRCCFFSEKIINKFDHYIQSTIIDFRLQDFIWKVFHRIPDTQGVFNTTTTACPNNIPGNIAERIERRKIKLPNLIDEHNYDIVDRYGLIINDINKIKSSEIFFTEYEVTLENYEIKNKIFGIRIRHRETGLTLVVQIGSFYFKHTIINPQTNKQKIAERKGYYVLNLVPENHKITELGIYDKYYVETNLDSYGQYYRPEQYYVTKPLDYKHQVYVEPKFRKEKEVGNEYYYYLAFLNNNKFIINMLVENDKQTMEAADKEYLPGLSGGNYKNKYLKYKKKYLELKEKT